jgi:hypothetical protein
LDITTPSDSKQLLFKGLGTMISQNHTESQTTYEIALSGMEHKLEDMKLVCAPFWDGDRL